jgi:DAK2 domain fusion protein YloV
LLRTVPHSPEIAVLLRWCDLTLTGLGAAREEIDALNVYPVPDADTGTNLYLTFESACAALAESGTESLVEALRVFARGALLGARGNSGVILSQLLRAGADQLVRGDPREPGRLLADTITLASQAAYAAVAVPVEGTMLSVARAASDAAQGALADAPRELSGQMSHVISAAAAAARAALQRTPDQLETLRLAGVVDAGGRGLCVVFDAAEEAFTGRRPPVSPSRRTRPLPSPLAPPAGPAAPTGPAYEVMYLLDAGDVEVTGLRRALAALGESLVVVGGDGLWNVHVHVDDVGAAVEAGIEAGRPHRVRVTHLAGHHDQGRCGATRGPAPVNRRGVVAVSAGDGLAALFSAAGAVVVEAAPGRRCSTGDILAAIRATQSDSVIVLPNDAATVAVAEAAARAARDLGVRAAVIPSRAQVQGLAAVAVHEPGRSFDDDVVHMTSAAGHARDGAVTIALRDAMTSAGACREGDVLGVVGGDFAIVGADLPATAIGVVERLLSAGGEMLTLVSGAGADPELVRRVTAHVEASRPTVDVVVYAGGQERYPLLVGVE